MAGRERRPYGHLRPSRVAQDPAAGSPAEARYRRRRTPNRGPWLLLALGLLSCLLVAAGLLWYRDSPVENARLAPVDRPASAEAPEPPVPPARRRAVEGLDGELRAISEAHAGALGVVVFDPYSGEGTSLNADRRFVAASLSKLYALLTLYAAASRGELSLDDEITMRASDVWAEGTGVLYRYPVGTTMTLRECAGFLIKESDNTAEVMLNRYLGEANIEAELRRAGARSTSYWMPNTTTPNDVMVVLKAIADPSYTSPELSAEMLDVMTDTSFEDRLPEPLPEDARVAHKIGSYGDTFSDAGLVFPEGSSEVSDAYYIVVIVGDTDEWTARSAIQEMSLAAYESPTTTSPSPDPRDDAQEKNRARR
jgi:beta-lactamase class A